MASETRFAAACKNADTACTEYNTDDIARAVDGTELVVVVLGTGKNSNISTEMVKFRNRQFSPPVPVFMS